MKIWIARGNDLEQSSEATQIPFSLFNEVLSPSFWDLKIPCIVAFSVFHLLDSCDLVLNRLQLVVMS